LYSQIIELVRFDGNRSRILQICKIAFWNHFFYCAIRPPRVIIFKIPTTLSPVRLDVRAHERTPAWEPVIRVTAVFIPATDAFSPFFAQCPNLGNYVRVRNDAHVRERSAVPFLIPSTLLSAFRVQHMLRLTRAGCKNVTRIALEEASTREMDELKGIDGNSFGRAMNSPSFRGIGKRSQNPPFPFQDANKSRTVAV